MSHAFVLGALTGLLGLVATVARSDRPNVVMILSDDQSYRDFGFMGNEQVHTPNLDSLARRSAVYPNGYVPMSVCRPSLATILTGLYPHQHGIHFNHPPPGLRAMRQMSGEQYHQARSVADVMIARVATLPRILAKHGYACLQTGKHWEGDFRTAGFTEGMTLGKPASRLGPVTGTREQANGDWVAHGNGDAGLVIGRETMEPIADFISRHSGREPFLVWYAPFLPHTPFDAPRRFHDLYEGMELPTHLRPYYAEIARFDDSVGQLMEILRRNDCLENTLIVFAIDNGFRPDVRRPDRQNQTSKLSPFEDGIRTPILIHLDAQTKPATHPQLVGTTDLVPTVLAAVGLTGEVTPPMQGINLMPSACGQELLPERIATGAIYPNDAIQLDAPEKHVRGRWIRSGSFKLVLPGNAANTLKASLFDLDTDPNESSNLYSDPNQTELVARLTQQLNDWWIP
ncbi:MAG: sulfatase-like hydrolase/transferase [Planctomycetota bacterium]